MADRDDNAVGPSHLTGLRRSVGWSQEMLADRAGISLRALRNIELGVVGRPHRHTLGALSVALGLSRDEAEAFVGLWHPQRGPELGVTEVVDPTASTRLPKSPWVSLAKASRDSYGPLGTIIRSTTDELIRATSDGVRTASALLSHPFENDFLHIGIADTRHCRLTRTYPVPDLGGTVFEFELDCVLAAGDVLSWGFVADYEPPPRATSHPVGETGWGLFRPGCSLTQELEFHPAARPAGVSYVWSSHLLHGRELERRVLRLDAAGRCWFHLPAAPVGTHMISWRW